MKELGDFFLAESLPDIENSSDAVTRTVTVHQTDDGEEMEALAVRQKRPRTLSPHSSCSSNHDEHMNKSTVDKSSKSDKSKGKNINSSTCKSSLPRPLKREKVVTNKKITKSK